MGPMFIPKTPGFRAQVRADFARQRLMVTLGAKLLEVEPGMVQIQLPFGDEFTQQHGFLHAGIITAVVDSACGYAAYSLMPAGASVLTVEYKVNFLNPAKGHRFLARGTVVKAGRMITVCDGSVSSIGESGDILVATMSATMMALLGRTRVSAGDVDR